MQPRGTEVYHEKSTLINAYLKEGCPADCGEYWTVDHIEAELQRGPYPSDEAEEAIKSLHDDTR